MNAEEKAMLAVEVIASKKGGEIEVLDVSPITQIAERFVIAKAKNRAQSQSIADELELKFKEREELPLRVEGYREGGWILLDFGDCIIHVFLPEEKEYYKLTDLWKDAAVTRYDEDGEVTA